MVTWNQFLESVYWNNTGEEYVVALGIFIVLFLVLQFFDRYLILVLKRYAARTKFKWDDLVVDFVNAIHWQFYAFLAFYLAAERLVIPLFLDRVLDFLIVIFIAFYAAMGLSRVVNGLTEKQIAKRKKSDNAQNTSMIKVFGTIFKIVIWIVAVLMVLDNLGVEITPLVASLGIGGIAIAIALQSVLGDVFSAFAIYFDKPFKEGDFIIVGNDMGVVKSIGIKTTRIQTLQGQELIMSNSELTSSRVNNYKRMERRRVVFGFGVEYDTPVRKLKKINSIVEKVIKNVDKTTLDRVHFFKFGDSSLDYEVVYYVESPDYNIYMDIQQKINLALKEAFEKEKIVFALPTRTVHLVK